MGTGPSRTSIPDTVRKNVPKRNARRIASASQRMMMHSDTSMQDSDPLTPTGNSLQVIHRTDGEVKRPNQSGRSMVSPTVDDEVKSFMVTSTNNEDLDNASRDLDNSSSYGSNDEEEAHVGRYKKEIAILETESQELREENDRVISSSSYTQNDDDREYKESYEKKIESLKTEVQQLKEEKNKMTASPTIPSGGSRKLRKDYKERIKTLEAEVQQLKEEKHKLFTRLREIGGVQLTESNLNIADLSDDNRPTKLVAKMSELYDNEWTDAFEYLTQIEGLPDEETVRQLLYILQTIYTLCLESTKKQAEDLKNAMLSYLGIPGESLSKDDFTLKEVLKRVMECRAKQFESILGRIVKDARDQFIDQLERKDCGILDKYIQKCAHVCLFMCIKDPQMYLDFGRSQMNGPPDDAANDFLLHFDTTQFVSFTRAGMYVEYVVWPAVYLYKNGPIMKRGVARGLNGEPEAKESTIEENGENSNIIGGTINVDADQG